MTPRMRAGTASMMNSHCHPARPSNPSRLSRMPDTMEPNITENGMAVMNNPMIRER